MYGGRHWPVPDFRLEVNHLSSILLGIKVKRLSRVLQIASYDGVLRYTVSHEMKPGGELTTDTDVELRVGRLT